MLVRQSVWTVLDRDCWSLYAWIFVDAPTRSPSFRGGKGGLPGGSQNDGFVLRVFCLGVAATLRWEGEQPLGQGARGTCSDGQHDRESLGFVRRQTAVEGTSSAA